jgi:CHC2 zinc finger/Bifunctional DNA primase/polymerase, N-terminal
VNRFRSPSWLSADDLIGLPGLEAMATGKQLVAPPSRHPDTGRPYTWQRPLVEAEIAVLPTWLAVLTGQKPEPRGTPPLAGDDPLRQLPAALYVTVLTGRELGRGAKVSCPFHEETEPSLHCYDDPDRGWYCFGCSTGGSIIDFGARLYGIEPRGAGFHEIRRRLTYDLLGARHVV